jgi:hypothetical protein
VTPSEEERAALKAHMDQLLLDLASSLVKYYNSLAGDYIGTLRITATPEFGVQWLWDWWWRPPGTLAERNSTGP